MTPASQLELAAAARADVVRAITLLERPNVDALDQSAAELTAAIARVEELIGEFTGKEIASPTKPVMVALRKDLWRADRLLRNAWELRIGRGSQIEYSNEGEWVRQPLSTAHWVLKA